MSILLPHTLLAPNGIARCEHQTLDASQPVALQQALIEIEYHQMDAGPFAGAFTDICVDKTHLVVESQNRTVLKHGMLPANRCHVTYVPDTSVDGRLITQRTHDGALGYLPPGLEFECLLPPSEIVYISFDREEFLFAAACDGHWVDDKINDPVWLDTPSRNGLPELVETLMASDQSSLSALGENYLKRLILDTALASLEAPPDRRSATSPSETTAYRITRKAQEFVNALRTEPLTVLDLCQALNTSRRTLQYSFMRMYGITPSAYLRLVRLNRARRDLLVARTGETVTSIALHWGFCHFARFAQHYRQMFGELPSQTLNKT